MISKIFLQVLGRPWLIEESQAHYWAGIAREIFITKSLDAVPNRDTRSNGFSFEFPRVNANGDQTAKGPVQLVRIEGPLMKYDSSAFLGMETLQQGIRAAANDDTVKSIILIIDSPGGTVDGTHNLAREIEKVKKPVVAFVNGYMCSAAYWIGSGAREIICDDANGGYNSTIGSIGTIAQWYDTKAADKKAGIKEIIVTASKSKRKTSYWDQIDKGVYDRLIKKLDNLNETFLSAIQKNRAGKLNLEREDVLEGDIYDGKDALKYGLIDKIADLPYAIDRSLKLARHMKPAF